MDADVSPSNILVVCATSAMRAVCREWQRAHLARVLLCESAAEAAVILHDIRFIGTELNAVIVDYRLPDKAGCRFVAEQRDNFPEASFALIADLNNTALNMWARAFQVLLRSKPMLVEDLNGILFPPPPLKPIGLKLELRQDDPVYAVGS